MTSGTISYRFCHVPLAIAIAIATYVGCFIIGNIYYIVSYGYDVHLILSFVLAVLQLRV